MHIIQHYTTTSVKRLRLDESTNRRWTDRRDNIINYACFRFKSVCCCIYLEYILNMYNKYKEIYDESCLKNLLYEISGIYNIHSDNSTKKNTFI